LIWEPSLATATQTGGKPIKTAKETGKFVLNLFQKTLTMNTPLFLVLAFITAGVLAVWYYLRTERDDIACSPLTRRANRRRNAHR